MTIKDENNYVNSCALTIDILDEFKEFVSGTKQFSYFIYLIIFRRKCLSIRECKALVKMLFSVLSTLISCELQKKNIKETTRINFYITSLKK